MQDVQLEVLEMEISFSYTLKNVCEQQVHCKMYPFFLKYCFTEKHTFQVSVIKIKKVFHVLIREVSVLLLVKNGRNRLQVSHPGYLPDCLDDNHAALLKVTFCSDEQWTWGEGQAYKMAAWWVKFHVT